ncbi:hypothetical protein MHYP_G00136160 [Metynnis hypsauchen]
MHAEASSILGVFSRLWRRAWFKATHPTQSSFWKTVAAASPAITTQVPVHGPLAAEENSALQNDDAEELEDNALKSSAPREFCFLLVSPTGALPPSH